MSFLQHGVTEEYYQKFIELQEKLRKSEEERLKLEMKFNEMVQVSREEEQIYYRKLRNQYKRFLEEDRRRQERNEKILRILERIESRAAMLAAKTQRFELLRKQYNAYLQRIISSRKQHDEPRMPTIVETKHHVHDEKNKSVKSPKVDVVKQYLSSLSSPACREEVLKTARSNELLPYSESSHDEDHDFPKYRTSASNLADQIIHSIHSRPKPEAHPREDRRWEQSQSFCATKTSPPRPPVRKPEDVEIFNYGGSGDGRQRGKKGDNSDFRGRLLENYDNEKIVREDYQNEKRSASPRSEEDVRTTVRFDDHYEPEEQWGAIPKYLQGPAIPQESDYEEEVYPNEKVESGGSRNEEVENFGEEDQTRDDVKEINLEDGERYEGKEEGVREECGEEKRDDTEEGQRGKKEEEELAVSLVEDAQFVSTDHVEKFQESKELVGKTEVDVDEIKSDPNDLLPYGGIEEDLNEAELKNDLPHRSEVQELETLAHDQVEMPVYAEEEKKEIQDLVAQDETNEQLNYEENDQHLRYASNEGDQPIQYDESNRPVHYDEHGQDIQYDEHGRLIQYDESGLPVQYDEQGQPVAYDEHGQFIQYSQPVQYDEQGQPIQYDEHGRAIPYDEHGGPIQYDEQNQQIQYDEHGRLIQYDEQGQPIQYDEQGQPIQYDENGRPIQYDEQGQPIQYDENGRPIQYDEQGQPIQYDENGRRIQYDEQGQPIQYDENGRPIQYDEQGQPIQYDENGRPIQYDEQGQPIQYYDEQYQYDPNSEYYQQYEEHQDPAVQKSEDKVEPTGEILQPQVGNEKETEDEKVPEDKKEEDKPETAKQNSNVMDMLDTDTESTKQEAKVSNESDFDFSNS